MPTGGSAGQVPTKNSGTDYDWTWGDGIGAHASATANLITAAHIKYGVISKTILTENWTGTQPPYSQTVAVTGVVQGEAGEIFTDLSGAADYAEEADIINNWALVYRVTSESNGYITLFSTAIPEVDLPVTIKLVRV
jgi:hypothetical protein